MLADPNQNFTNFAELAVELTFSSNFFIHPVERPKVDRAIDHKRK